MNSADDKSTRETPLRSAPLTTNDARTSATLLVRLQDLTDQAAWDEFVDRYAPRIYTWCRSYKMQETDAADITQDVLCKLVERMRKFQYDPSKGSFRGWLKTITINVVRDLIRSWKKPIRGAGDTHNLQQLAAIQDPDAVSQLAEEMESEHQAELLEEAHRQVAVRVKPHNWQAYYLTAVERLSAAEAAEKLGLQVAEIYVAKSRVIKMLRTEVKRLEQQF
ncbi:MAG: RNA polymerase sigma factor (sigma-70 family) [Pirellulaceae bacterium]|jgi:RNA polymerase sigma factor (sigma-70 family)